MINPLPNQPTIDGGKAISFSSLEVEGVVHIPLNAKKWTTVKIGDTLYLFEKEMEEPKRHPGVGDGLVRDIMFED